MSSHPLHERRPAISTPFTEISGLARLGSMSIPTYQLNDGHDLPVIGFGTAGLRGPEATDAVVAAIENGYRLIDTAVNYGNEEEVGAAISRSGVQREELRITSKIPGRHHAYDDAVRSTHESLDRLG